MIDLKAVNKMSLRRAAEAYLNEGWTLIPLEMKSKSASVTPGWNDDNYCNERMCGGLEHWDYFLTDNIGVNLGKSGLVTLDIDNKDGFLKCMDAIADKLREAVPSCETPFWCAKTAGIASGRRGSGKLVFKSKLYTLEPRKLQWRSNEKSECVFELRTEGQQDVLPPSIHPETLQPYRWAMNGGSKEFCILDMPEDMVYLWEHWADFQPIMEMANPSYVAPEVTDKMKKSGIKYLGTNYIEMWKNQQNLESLLTSNGYVRKGNNRLLSPDSHSGNAGIVLYSSGTTFYSFGESDRFADGHSHDAYDVLVECEYNGDRKSAWEHILEYFGIEKNAVKVANQIKAKYASITKKQETIC